MTPASGAGASQELAIEEREPDDIVDSGLSPDNETILDELGVIEMMAARSIHVRNNSRSQTGRNLGGDLEKLDKEMADLKRDLAALAKSDASTTARVVRGFRDVLGLSLYAPALESFQARVAVKQRRQAAAKKMRDRRHPTSSYINDVVREIADTWTPSRPDRRITAHGMAVEILADVQAALKQLPLPPDLAPKGGEWPPRVNTAGDLRKRLKKLNYPKHQ